MPFKCVSSEDRGKSANICTFLAWHLQFLCVSRADAWEIAIYNKYVISTQISWTDSFNGYDCNNNKIHHHHQQQQHSYLGRP